VSEFYGEHEREGGVFSFSASFSFSIVLFSCVLLEDSLFPVPGEMFEREGRKHGGYKRGDTYLSDQKGGTDGINQN